jgi:arylsulfatase A-like enzyme
MRSLIVSLLLIASSVLGADRPNVLFIAIDDLNHWVGYLGRNKQAVTPNIDKLAARGVRFTRSYCAAPVCNPSRTALMSGLRPGQTGVYDNNHDWRKAIAIDKPLTTVFRNAGYDVKGAGKIYHEAYRRSEEWNDYLENEGGMPKVPAGQSDGVGGIKFAALKDAKDEDFNDWNIVSYCIEQLGKTHDKPLFLACGIHKPHMPWNVPQKYFDMHPLDQIELPPTKEGDLSDVPPAGLKMAKPEGDHAAILASGRWKEAIQAYLAAASYCDMLIGRLMDAFDKSAYKDNTVIVFWSDHGWHLGEKEHWRKFALWEEATRAPLIWIAPGITKPNSVCERTVDFMSVYPTLLDLCGIAKPGHVEGPSLKPLLAEPSTKWDLPAITTFGFQNHAVRTEGWRYIRYANGDEELYDETADPYEWTNLANKPEHAALKAQLTKHLPTTNLPESEGKTKPKNKPKNKKKKAE